MILAFCFNFGCSSNSSSGTNNTPSNSTTFNAGPYLAFSDNKAFTGHLKGTTKYLDSAGNVTEVDQIDQHSTETIGALIKQNGIDARAIYYYPNGVPKAIGYIGYASDTSDVMGGRLELSSSV